MTLKSNFASGTVWTGDNLPVMRGISSVTASAEFRPLPSGVIGKMPVG